jgi:hypothetical protein
MNPCRGAVGLYGGDYLHGDVEEGDYPIDLIRQRTHQSSTKATSSSGTVDGEPQDREGESEHKGESIVV